MKQKKTHQKRSTFSGKIGFVLSAAGASVGLGNIWRFPYLAAKYGGGIFLLIYILLALTFGYTMIIAETSIGRLTKKSPVGAFRFFGSSRWLSFGGWINAIIPLLIVPYYSVIGGWVIKYLVEYLMGKGKILASDHYFTNFISNGFSTEICFAIFSLCTLAIIYAGVRNGIERVSKIMMPLLFLILLIMCVRSVTLPNAEAGLLFLFKPDFSKLTSSVVLSALGQAFFSLSLGMGCLITYSSYFGKDTNMQATAWQVTIINTLVAVLAGIMIFPAVFSFGITPSAGAELVFITLPNVFGQLPLSGLWSCIFYILLAMAALTSTISLHEVATAYVLEEFHMTRKKAALIVSLGVFFLGIFSSLSFGVMKGFTIGGLAFFDALDYLTAKIMLPLGGMLTCIFVGTRVDKKVLKAELTNEGTLKFRLFGAYVFFMKYVAPIAIGIVFLNELGILRWITGK